MGFPRPEYWSVSFIGSVSKSILEISHIFGKDIKISRLIHVKLKCQERPETVVHPHSRDAVAVSDELALFRTDYRRIGTIHTDTRKITYEVISCISGIPEEQRKRILPEVTPASSSSAVVVVRQERAAVELS